ncbi:hypothetical protein NPX13_g457 [Xylaria arbuscula]|uniref:Uncharacterized protein n=1 Tax=Xylaria arbuscula TaxID=114810 RepID=A0A9W8NPD5_9PEZI|nr:hypothetical protein NPX13_g457 [Xylaria arbuscula]
MLKTLTRHFASNTPRPRLKVASLLQRCTSTQPNSQDQSNCHDVTSSNPSHKTHKTKANANTIAQLDEEVKRKMYDIAGDGGEAGIEYEDGKPVAMKRSVKNNMFRYI